MLAYAHGALQVDGRDAEELARTLGTPCFVLGERRLRANYHALRDGLARGLVGAGGRARIRYCAKTNPEPRVLATLAQCGSEVLASHAGEVRRARDAGFAAERIAYQRPVLEAAELERALDAGVRRFHVYREEDVGLLSAVAAAHSVQLRVSMRVATHAPALRLSPLRLFADRLGLRAERVLPCARRIAAARELTLCGLDFHAGTQLGSPQAYAPMVARVLALAVRIREALGVVLDEVDVGGGLPSPSLVMRSPLSPLRADPLRAPAGDAPERLGDFAAELARIFVACCRHAGWNGLPTLVVEPGRALVSNAGVMLTRVRALQGRWVYLDATRNYLPENFFLVSRALLPAREMRGARTRLMNVSGSTLNSMDVMDVLRPLPAELRVGDLMVWCDAGAYSMARATTYACEPPRIALLDARGALAGAGSDEARAPRREAVADA